jgi:acetyltransferase
MRALLAPRTLAIVGASADRTKIGSRLLERAKTYGFRGSIYCVNPHYSDIDGTPCLPQIGDIPEKIDLALVAVPAISVIECARACGEAGVGAIAVMTSGFSEAGPDGAALEEELVRIAAKHGMALLGPNADGLVNVQRGLACAFSTALETPGLQAGNLSFVTQSGAVGTFAIALARESGVGVDYWVSVGNAAMLHVDDYAGYLLGIETTEVLGVYVEGMGDASGLLDVADNYLVAGKPMVLLKGGSTIPGQQAAKTHTGSLAGNARIWEGAARAHGIELTDTFEDFFDTCAAFSAVASYVGKRAVVITSSGAAGVLAADAADRVGLELADLTEDTRERLSTILPFGVTGNPLDLAGVLGTTGLTRQVLVTLLADDDVDAVILITGARDQQAARLVEEVCSAQRETGKPIFVSWTACSPEIRRSFWERGVPCFADASHTVSIFRRVSRYWTIRDEILESLKASEAPTSEAPDRKSMLLSLGSPGGMLSERQSKEVLRSYGMKIPMGGLARTAVEAVELSHNLGFPIAAKVEAVGVSHKSDVGGVRLGLMTEDELVEAFAGITDEVKSAAGDPEIAGIYLEQMVQQGAELILGITRDSQFGLCLVLGLGGVWTEQVNDIQVQPLPLSRWHIEQMLGNLRGRDLLLGKRGRHPVSIDAVVEAALSLMNCATSLGDRLEAIDVNPLMALEASAIVLDARIQFR